MRALGFLCMFVWLLRLEPPEFIGAEPEQPASVHPGRDPGGVVLGGVARGLWSRGGVKGGEQQKVPPHNSHLSSSQPGTSTLMAPPTLRCSLSPPSPPHHLAPLAGRGLAYI